MYPDSGSSCIDVPDPAERARRVLVVDDHSAVRAAVESLLRRAAGLVVVGSASDGREAITLVDEVDPEVVLMDLSMPVLGGVEATRRLGDRSEVPVVAFTGSARLAREAVDAGAVACVFKDAPASELIAALRGAAGGRSQP